MYKKPDRKINKVYLHCSASDHTQHDDVAVMAAWHKDRWPRYCSDEKGPGYHYFIQKDGNLQEGRDVELVPVAQGGNNTGTIAICVHGLKEDKFTNAQFVTLVALCYQIEHEHEGMIRFHGHKEVAAKACPVFDYKLVLGLDAAGRMTKRPNPYQVREKKISPKTTPKPTLKTARKVTLSIGAKGDLVALLQEFLSITDDGDFGGGTLAAVKSFQSTHGLVNDGVVGSGTWAAIEKQLYNGKGS